MAFVGAEKFSEIYITSYQAHWNIFEPFSYDQQIPKEHRNELMLSYTQADQNQLTLTEKAQNNDCRKWANCLTTILDTSQRNRGLWAIFILNNDHHSY